MNKENYTPVDMEIIKFASEDVITTSPLDTTNDANLTELTPPLA